MKSLYATDTSVPADRSKAEIEKVLTRYGADRISFGTSRQDGVAFVQFTAEGLPVHIVIPLPAVEDYRLTPAGRARSESQVLAEWEGGCRQLWRVLLLLIKAQCEAVALGVVLPRDVWLPWVMLPSGKTIGQEIAPEFDKALSGGRLALPWPGR